MTSSAAPAERVAAALGALLLRGNRAHLYDQLTQGIDGVDSTTYPVLSGLARSGPTTATRLADRIGLDRTVTTRYATRLEQAGLIARAPDPGDARATYLELTAQGRKVVKSLRKNLVAVLAAAMEGWPSEETEIFVRALERLTEALLPASEDGS